MGIGEILELVVCVFAVYGVYALLCRFLSRRCYKGDLSVALHVKREGEIPPDDGLRRALLLTEAQKGRMQSPVILLDCKTDDRSRLLLEDSGCDVYYKNK